MLGQFRDKGDLKMLKKLEASPVTLENGTPPSYAAIRDFAMHSLGIGTTHEMKSVISGIFFPSLKCREYTLAEKLNTWVGKSRAGISIVWADILTTDLSEKVTELKIPVYFFEGAYDYTCSSAEAKRYFEKLNAPVKGFYLFEKSAHSPFFEEPDKMQKIVKEDVLTGMNNLADIK
jgi:pimeloyl-ACP methyl ester carboxylesterase